MFVVAIVGESIDVSWCLFGLEPLEMLKPASQTIFCVV